MTEQRGSVANNDVPGSPEISDRMQQAKERMQLVGQRLGRGYPLTTFAFIGSVLVVCQPQVYRLASIGPWTSDCWWLTLLFVGYLVLLSICLLVGVSTMLLARRHHDGSTVERWVDRLVQVPLGLVARWRSYRVVIVVSAFLTAGAWLFLPTVWPSIGFLSARLAYRALPALLLFVFGLYVWLPPSKVLRDDHTKRWRIGILYVTLVSLSVCVGELMWTLPDSWPGYGSFRLYSLWAIAFLLFLLLGTGALVESLFEHWLWRMIALLCLLTYLARGSVLVPAPSARATVLARAPEPHEAHWMLSLRDRISNAPPGPVIFVAASGGGSRAALYTALVFEALRHTPWKDKGAHSMLADSVVLVSSVSGGSLASAYYLAQRQAGDVQWEGDWRNSTIEEIANSMRSTSKAVLEELTRVSNARAYDSRRIYRQIDSEIAGLPSKPATTAPWLMTSRFLDDMSTDFMAPLLRGVFTPFLERGESVSQFWTHRFGWSEIEQQATLRANVPVTLFNVTDVDTGHRVIVSFPALSQRILGDSMRALSPTDGFKLADAVRVSANFPWGFEVAEVQLGKSVMRLIDGGVLDNTGIDSLSLLVRQIRRLAALNDRTTSASRVRLYQAADEVFKLLLQRGVILLEIDSGARPAENRVLSLLAPAIAAPIDALSRAGFGNAENIKQSYISGMQSDLTAAESTTTRLKHVPFVCKDSVMTAWALDPAAKAKLLVTFMFELAQTQPFLERSRAELHEAETEGSAFSSRVQDAAKARKQLYDRLTKSLE